MDFILTKYISGDAKAYSEEEENKLNNIKVNILVSYSSGVVLLGKKRPLQKKQGTDNTQTDRHRGTLRLIEQIGQGANSIKRECSEDKLILQFFLLQYYNNFF